MVFLFKQKTAYEMRISDWSSDVCSSDLGFAFIDPDASLYALWGDAEPDRPGNRFNDGKLDREGRFWAGTMDDAEVERSGQLFRFDPDHSWSLQDKGYRVPNGPAFRSDGRSEERRGGQECVSTCQSRWSP